MNEEVNVKNVEGYDFIPDWLPTEETV